MVVEALTHFQSIISKSPYLYEQNHIDSHLHTCWEFSLRARSNWAIAKASEALSPLVRFDVSIISIHQDVTQSFTLSKTNVGRLTETRRNGAGEKKP